MWKKVFQPQFPGHTKRPNIGRLLFILGLATAVVLLASHALPVQRTALHQAQQFSVHLILSADILYRLSIFARTSGQSGQAEALRQMALALYERSALGPAASAPAVYRLGIFYSKSGYPDHGRQFLLYAAQLDQSHHRLYLLLSSIYEQGPVDEVSLVKNGSLLADQPRWLAGLTRADLYERIGQPIRSQQLRQQWQRQQILFGLIVSGLLAICGLLGLVGLVVVTSAVIGRARHASGRPMERLYVPWHTIDIVEAIVVLVFLMVALNLGAARLGEYLRLSERPGLAEALLVAAVYLVTMTVVVALIRYRIGAHSRPWHLLGVRVNHLPAQVGWGLAGYGVFVCLLGAGWFVLQNLGLAGSLPAAALKGPIELVSQTQAPSAYAVYFVLICLIAPVVEEIIFRGFIYAGLRRVMGMTPAMLLSAALFASIHLSTPTGGVVVVGLIALVLAYLYERNRSVVPSIVAHSLHNTLVFVLLAAHGLL